MKLLPEVSDCVIDHLSTDKTALKACGLAGRQWLPRSRFHLFREVRLRVGPGLAAIGSIRDVEGYLDMEGFLEVVDASSSDIFATIQRLAVTYVGERSVGSEHLLRFSPCFQLQHLNVQLPRHQGNDAEVLHTQLASVANNWSSLSSFSLSFSIASLSVIFDIIACFPRLEQLTLLGQKMDDTIGSLAALPPRIRSLDTGILRGGEFFFRHLLSLPTLPLFRVLKLDDEMDMRDGAPITEYLQCAGHAVQSVVLEIWTYLGVLEHLAVQHCTQLRHLIIQSYVGPFHNVSAYLSNLLSAVTSSSLSTIEIEIVNLRSWPHELAAAANGLDRTLAHPRFNNLQRFVLCGDALPLARGATDASES
ncbi:hypothetical protein GGX14DRAFT_427841 [Mycena pura]|uniref:Uncharacterized protein n=1 Tax=Mycena pura TaxID=153505 RepID=A0AAD7E2A2_9AGAR|nr:hypothetical protein GGX14DRAFT_427841 [Mycena pura]